MKRIIAFALALVLVFGVSFALYKPERIEAAARETMDDEWVGYFFSLEPFDGKIWATKTDDEYDFGVPGVPVFLTITDILPGEPGYVENDDFNHVIGSAMGDETDGHGLSVVGDDNGDRYETGGDIVLDAQARVELYECYVYRTAAGEYYAECAEVDGMKVAYSGPGFGLSRSQSISAERTSSWTVNNKKQSRSIKVSVSFEEHTAAGSVAFVWMDDDKNALLREEYTAGTLPEALTAPESASMLVVTQRDTNDTVTRTLCTAEDTFTTVYTPSALSGLLRVSDITLDWGEETA